MLYNPLSIFLPFYNNLKIESMRLINAGKLCSGKHKQYIIHKKKKMQNKFLYKKKNTVKININKKSIDPGVSGSKPLISKPQQKHRHIRGPESAS